MLEALTTVETMVSLSLSPLMVSLSAVVIVRITGQEMAAIAAF